MAGWIMFLIVYAVVLMGGYYVIKQMAKKSRDKYNWADEPYAQPPVSPPAEEQSPPQPPAAGQ